MKTLITILVAVLACGTGSVVAETWMNLDYPGSSHSQPNGISDKNIVGYADGIGYIYNGTTWTDFNPPNSGGIASSGLGIDGNKIVGSYYGDDSKWHCFLYDGVRWNVFDNVPGAIYMELYDVSGTSIVGNYYSSATRNNHGLLFNGTTWATMDYPGATSTYLRSIDGNKVVGFQEGAPNGDGSFLYDGTIWVDLNMPGATSTYISGIDGDHMVGWYNHDGLMSGFLYDGTTWATIEPQGAKWSHAYGISGDTIVGRYGDGNWQNDHGFIYTIPEPSTIILLFSGLSALLLRRKK